MKQLRIIITHDLPESVFDHARAVLAGEKALDAINAAIAEHMPTATVAHAIAEPEAPKAKKVRQALGKAGDGVRVAEPDALLFRGNEKGAETAEAPGAKKGEKVGKAA